MSKTLQLEFETQNGKNFTINLRYPNENLTAQDVQNAMNQIITINPFENITLTAIAGARYIERQITELF